MLPMEELHSDASATGSLLEEVFKLYTAVREGVKGGSVRQGAGPVAAVDLGPAGCVAPDKTLPLKPLQRSGAEVLRLVRARYSPQATFVDPLVLASPRSSIELQFFALQK